jgi:hypothetical protein
MQSIIRVTVELELFAWGTIPSAMASASATPIDLVPLRMLMPMPMLMPMLMPIPVFDVNS